MTFRVEFYKPNGELLDEFDVPLEIRKGEENIEETFSANTLMHNWANRGGMSHTVVPGGTGKISEALSSAVNSWGGEIRTNAEVKQVLIKDMRAMGVVLSNGDEIFAHNIISAADPKQMLGDRASWSGRIGS